MGIWGKFTLGDRAVPEGQVARFLGTMPKRGDPPHALRHSSRDPHPARAETVLPTPALRRPGACLTQQRPQVLQAGQHVFLRVQHLLDGLLHIPVAPSGEHSAVGSLGPAGGAGGACAARVTA